MLELYINNDQTAKTIRISPRTLEKWRVQGRGPAYLKLGARVVYARRDIEQWLEAQRRTSTSQAAACKTTGVK